jgi:hypothetical protein
MIKEREKVFFRLFNASLGLLLIAISFNSYGQQINGCVLQDDQWQILILNEDEGSKTLEFVYNPCNLNLLTDVFLKIEVENNSPVELVADISLHSSVSWKDNEGRHIIPAQSSKDLKLILYREAPDASSPWFQEFSEVRALPGGHVIHWKAFNLDEIKKVKLTLSWEDLGGQVYMVRVKTPVGDGAYTFPEIDFNALPRPLVDEMGQLKTEEWDDKLESRDALVGLGSSDTSNYLRASVNEKFSKYGGWKEGPQLEAKGRFYTAKHMDKWWLVDPEGYLFWSQGVTGVGKGGATPTTGRASLFPDFADEKSSELWPILEGETLNNKIDFYMMNVKRKYGLEWEALHDGVTMGRMKTWGLNTYAAWSSIPDDLKHPYTLIIHPTTQWIGSIDKIVDPFSATFQNSLKNYLSALSDRAGDPWNIGIFVNNELHWNKENSIPDEVLKLSNTVPARAAMEQFLTDKYTTIASLNALWSSNFISFEDIDGTGSDQFSTKFREDMNDYLDYYADTYYRICEEEVENYLPGTLYLGSRIHGNVFNNKIVLNAASRHCDVFSFNYYQPSLNNVDFSLEVDKPMIIGEFHFGTGSHGVWGTGLVPASDLQNQADLYGQYVAEALDHPNIVGAHWFQWSDQMVTGRKDGENFRIGLVDVTDQPYQEMLTAISKTSKQLYGARSNTGVRGEEQLIDTKGEALVYPNPNTGRFIVRLPDNNIQASLTLISLNGSTVYAANIDSEEELVLPDNILGLHVLLLNIEGEISSRKLMIR